MVRRRGDAGFRVITWDEALGMAAAGLRATPGDRMAFYLTSRGITNEVLLRGPEGRAVLRLRARRQLGAPLSRRIDNGHEGDARLRRFVLQLRPTGLARI
jgi:anaerobic selenocysteine-containing dehydrogenase